MKRFKFILVGALLCMSCGQLFAQSDFFYSADGKKEYFKIRKDKVVIKSTSENKTKALSVQTALQSAYNIDNNMLIATVDTLKTKIEDLKRNPDISDVSYALEYADGTLQMLTNQIFAKPKDGMSMVRCLDLSGLSKSVEKMDLMNTNSKIYLINLNVNTGEILQLCRNLFETELFDFVEPSFFREITPSNPYYSNQWGFKNTGQYGGTQGMDIKVEQAWGISTGTNVVVAVVDERIALNYQSTVGSEQTRITLPRNIVQSENRFFKHKTINT